MVKVKEQDLLDKWLTQADIQEFKDTWSFSDTATAKIKETMQPVQTPVTPQVEQVATQPIQQPVQPTQPVVTEEVKMETPKPVAPVTPQVSKPTNLWSIQGKNITSEAPEFKWADGNTYKTVRFDDWSLWTVKIWEWWVNELIGKTYKDEQRWDVKQVIEQGLNNTENIYKQLVINGNIPEIVKNSKPYANAKARFDIANKYLNYTEDQLYNAYVNGEINQTLEKDLTANPYLSLAKEKYNKKLVTDNINNEAINSLNIYNRTNGGKIIEKTEKTALEILNDKILNVFENMWKSESEILSFKDYMANNYPDLVSQTQELNAKNKRLKELADQRDARLENIIAENPWISINRANMLASRQNKDINKEIQSMSYEIANLASNVQYMTNMADKEYWYKLDQQARQDQLLQEQRGYAFNLLQGMQDRQFQLEDRAYAEQQADKELQQQYNFTYWDFNSQDPMIRDTAIRNAVAQLYTQYPIPWMEAPAVKEQKVRDLMAQGMTWQQAISQLEQEIRATDRYKQLIAWKDTSTQDWAKLSDWTLYNQRTWETKSVWDMTTGNLWDLRSLASQFPWQAWAKNNNPAWITWNANFDAWKGTAALLKEAWINYTKWTSRPASEWGNYVSFDTIEDGLAAQRIIMTQTYGNSTVEQMLGKWVWTWEALNYAKQVAWNAWIDLKTKVSDLSDTEVSQLQMAKIQKESPWLFKILNKPAQDTSFNDTDVRVFNSLTDSAKSKNQSNLKYQSFVEAQNEVYTNPDSNINDILKYSAWGKDLWETSIQQLSKFNQALSQVSELSKKINEETTWPIIWRLRSYNPYDSNAQALKAEINSLIPNIARWVYWEVWVLTDADVEQYRKTLPNLQSTEDTNKLVLAMTLKTMMNGYKGQLQSLAWAGKDVSKLQGKYAEYEKTVNSLIDSIGKKQTSTWETKENTYTWPKPKTDPLWLFN